MGKKQPLTAATKQRAGADITRFLERRSGQGKAGGFGAHEGHVAGVRPPDGRAPTPGKHLLDNVLLSQDMDDGGMQVVWASSPTAAYSPLKGPNVSQDAASASQPPDSSQASKEGLRKSLIQAVQRTASDTERRDGQQAQSAPANGDDEQLLARRNSNRDASTSAPDTRSHSAHHKQGGPCAGGAEALLPNTLGAGGSTKAALVPAPGCSAAAAAAAAAGAEADQVMQDVLAGAEVYRTPAAAKPVGITRLAGAIKSAECLRPPSSGLTAGKRPLVASSKKAASGNKRRALLDLLDQVELMVKRGPSQAQTQAAPLQGTLEGPSMAMPGKAETQAVPANTAAAAMPVAAGATVGVAAGQAQGKAAGAHAADCSRQVSLQPPHLSGVSAVLPPVSSIAPTLPSWCDASATAPTGPTAATGPKGAGPTPGVAAAPNLGASMPPPPSRQAHAHAATPGTAGGALPSTQPVVPASAPNSSRTQGPTPLEQPINNGWRHAHAQPPVLDTRSSVGTPAPLSGPIIGQSATGPPNAALHASISCPHPTGPAAAPADELQPIVLRPPTVQSAPVGMMDDDDDDWGDIDVDALLANVASKEASQGNAGAAAAPSGVTPGSAAASVAPGGMATVSNVANPQPHAAPVVIRPPGQQQAQQQAPPQHQWQPAPQAGRPPLVPQPQRTQQLGPPPHEQALLPPAQPPAQPHAVAVGTPVARPAPSLAAAADARISAAVPAPPLLGSREEVHHVVLEVEEPQGGHFKVLRCFNEYKGHEMRVYLRDMWADQAVAPGDCVNVLGGRVLADSVCEGVELSASEGLLILHPDVLLSGTNICAALRCPRQAWLQERVAGGPSGPGGEKALLGSMMHELLQASLRAAVAGRLDKGEMLAQARSILTSHTAQLLETRQDEASVLAHLSQQLDAVLAWCNTYVTPNPAAPLGGRIEPASGDAPTFCRVTEVLDIEESIWAPKYGLKGVLDASLRVTLSVKDPLHNQRTLSGGFASTQQQQRMQQGQMGQQGPARFHGMQQGRASDGGAAAGGAGGGRGWAQQQGQGVGQGHGPPRRQHSWSVGTETGLPPGQQQQQAEAPPGVTRDTVIVPFEFKTGKDWHEHRAQVLLYLLLMEDRYQDAVRTGLLWNIHKPTMQAVRYAHHELVGLVMHRNRLAAYLVGGRREPPPPLLGSEADRKCDNCSLAPTCSLYLAASAHGGCGNGSGGGAGGRREGQSGGGGGGGGGQSGASQLAEMDLHAALRERLSAISPSTAAFFAHWVRLVDLEEQAARANHTDIWAITGPQRERVGGCVSQLVLERELPPQEGPDGRRYLYVFSRPVNTAAAAGTSGSSAPGAAAVAASGPAGGAADAEEGVEGGLMSAGFALSDMGVLGVEGRHAAAARVSVVDVTKDTITLSCRKEIKVARLAAASQFSCQCQCQGRTSPTANTAGRHANGSNACYRCGAAAGAGPVPRVTWRLDREEAASVFAQMRLNLALLGAPGAGSGWQAGGGRKGGGGSLGGCDAAQMRREAITAQLRKLVIELQAPQQGLATGAQGASSQLSGSLASSQLACSNAYLREHAGEMNGEQLEAVQRALAMQDYAVLLGMPGTGKTTTIVHIIRALVEARVSVLVASYTNSAVDNILLKLVGSPVSFVRLGSAASVHPGVRPYMPGGQAHPDTSVAGLQELMAHVHVVGTTCLSVHAPLLAGRTFGVCILDEASQVTLPASLGALALARSFLLVGDHYQLSPLVVSREAAQGGLGVSLFRRLSEAHPQAVVTLRSQYRMAADIMALSNALVYNGRMLCGDERVANAALHLPGLQALATHGSAPVPLPAHAQPSAPGAGYPGAAQALGPWPSGLRVPGWLLSALHPQCRVLLLDTDGVAGCREQVLQDGMVNSGEVRLVHALAAAMVAAGLAPRDIGVASPYKAQVAALQAALAGLSGAAAQPPTPPPGDNGGGAVEVLTVDKYQGRDKPAIVLSLVRCNTSRSAGRLLADWQRLNVAITRARTKLLLVGSAATLASIPLLADMLALLRRNGWVTQLPVDCLSALPQLPAAVTANQQQRAGEP